MISSTSSVGCDSSRNLLCQLLHRITTLILTIAAATLSIDSAKNGICAELRSVPNIVLILADDLGYGDLGCYGATKVKTPNIDRLASEGRRFLDAHSASAVCTPSRYALLTGEYPFRKNLWGPVMNPSPLVIDPSRTTIASLLRKQGYATACIGKWHLGFGDQPKPDWNADLEPGPLELGFDHYFGIPVVSSHPPFVWVEDHRVVGLDPADPLRYGGVPPTQRFPEKMLAPAISGGPAAHALYRDEQVGATLTDKSVAWLREHRDQPFFLYFASLAPHAPYQATKADQDRYAATIEDPTRRAPLPLARPSPGPARWGSIRWPIWRTTTPIPFSMP